MRYPLRIALNFRKNMVLKMNETMIDKSGISYWYPRIKNIIPTPKTVIIPVTNADFKDYKPIYKLLDKIQFELNNAHITYPLFLKTDIYSEKWEWANSCFVESDRYLFTNMIHLLVKCEEEDLGEVKEFVIKEFLSLETAFLAFNNMPVAKERRYFIENKQVLCHHPYWEENSIEFYSDSYPSDWKQKLNDINNETGSEIAYLSELAVLFARLIDDDGYYSVDFAMDIHGNWYLIDVANGHRSYHNESCKIFIDKQ